MTEPVATTSASQGQVSLEKLREIFPQFVTENTIDFDKLQKFFEREGLVSSNEKYGLNWAGRSHAFGAIRVPSTGTLVPQPEESKNWDDTENIFIEGDNLEVLKLLQKHYANPGKIKMIYIDPPYNTGKDFVYKDNFTQGVADYYEQTGQTQGGVKMTANTEKNGRYHSDWLTMMYPRLFLARNLLRDDGVIFVSIDDNEVANLRLIMDEIFGEENFVAQFIWNKKNVVQNDADFVSVNHEYVICYGKRNEDLEFNLMPRTEEQLARYKNPDNDSRGVWTSVALQAKSGSGTYEIEFDNGVKWKPVEGTYPRLSKESLLRAYKEGRLWFGESGKNVPRLKKYLSEVQDGVISNTLLLADDVGSTQLAKETLKKLIESNVFDTPKPIGLISKLLTLGSGQNNHDIILDFFAGSGTTAHAVMDLNAEDGGNRKWVCVQLPETTDEKSEAYKAGYKTIAEISRERIRRAGDKIGKGDVGFKSFKLSSSNYRKWNELTADDDTEKLLQQSKLFIENPLVDNYNKQSVVFEILVKEGFDLNTKIVRVPQVIKTVNGKEKTFDFEYYVALGEGRKLVVTFEPVVEMEKVEVIDMGNSDVFVCFDNALDDTTKVNLGRKVSVKTI